MASLLSLPREIRDEIIDYTLIPERVEPTIDTKCPAFCVNVAQREQRSWKENHLTALRQVMSPFPPISVNPPRALDLIVENDPQRYAYRSTKATHPLLLANHQLRAELQDSIRRHKELRHGEVTLLLIDEAMWVPIWTEFPSFRGFETFHDVTVSIKIVTTVHNSFPRPGNRNPIHADFSRLWEVPSISYHDTGLSGMMEAFSAIVYGILRLWLPSSGLSVSHCHLYAIENLNINIEKPNSSDDSLSLGPPLQWSMRHQGYLPTKLFTTNHTLDPEWLLEHIKNALPGIIKNDLTLYLPSVCLNNTNGLNKAQGRNINTVSEGLGSIFERVGHINLAYDQKMIPDDSQIGIIQETPKIVESQLRNVGHWRFGGTVVDGAAIARREWAKTVSKRQQWGLPVSADLLDLLRTK